MVLYRLMLMRPLWNYSQCLTIVPSTAIQTEQCPYCSTHTQIWGWFFNPEQCVELWGSVGLHRQSYHHLRLSNFSRVWSPQHNSRGGGGRSSTNLMIHSKRSKILLILEIWNYWVIRENHISDYFGYTDGRVGDYFHGGMLLMWLYGAVQ